MQLVDVSSTKTAGIMRVCSGGVPCRVLVTDFNDFGCQKVGVLLIEA